MKGKPSGRRNIPNPCPGNGVVSYHVSHHGSKISCNIIASEDSMSLAVTFTDGTDQKSQMIYIQGDSPVDMFCPSVEGTVIICWLKSGKECVYDTLTGSLLTAKDLMARRDEIHVYI